MTSQGLSAPPRDEHLAEPIGTAPRLPQIDLYGAVHKGLRLVLTDLVTRMARVDADDNEGVQRIVDDLSGVLDLCERHAEHEDRYLHHAIERRHAGASAQRAQEHELQHAEIARLHELALAVCAADPGDRGRLYRTLALHYACFVGESLVHMSKEELETQAALDALYSEEELRTLHGELVSSIDPVEVDAFMSWMLRGASPREREQLSRR